MYYLNMNFSKNQFLEYIKQQAKFSNLEEIRISLGISKNNFNLLKEKIPVEEYYKQGQIKGLIELRKCHYKKALKGNIKQIDKCLHFIDVCKINEKHKFLDFDNFDF